MTVSHQVASNQKHSALQNQPELQRTNKQKNDKKSDKHERKSGNLIKTTQLITPPIIVQNELPSVPSSPMQNQILKIPATPGEHQQNQQNKGKFFAFFFPLSLSQSFIDLNLF